MWLAVWSAIERHTDHANKDTINKVIQYGVPVYSCEETRLVDKRIINIKKGRKTSIGGFKIQPIPLKHSCECYGYLIETPDNQKIVFSTDCCEFLYKIKNVNLLSLKVGRKNLLTMG
jgi:mRNA degradation ribonuclease J1/J2